MASWRLWATGVGHSELAYGRLAAGVSLGLSGVVVDAVEALERYTKAGAHKHLLGTTIDDDLSQVIRSLLVRLVTDVTQVCEKAGRSGQAVQVTLGLPPDADTERLALDVLERTAPAGDIGLLIGVPASAEGSLIAARLLEGGHNVLLREVASAEALARLIEGAAQAIRRADPARRPQRVAMTPAVWQAVQAVAQRLEAIGELSSPLPAATLRRLLKPFVQTFQQARQDWLADPVLAEVTLLLVLEDASPQSAQANWWRAVTGWQEDLILAPAIARWEEVRQALGLGLPDDLVASDEDLTVALLGRDLTLDHLADLPPQRLQAEGWRLVLDNWRLDRDTAGSVHAGPLTEALAEARRELAEDQFWAHLAERQGHLAAQESSWADLSAQAWRPLDRIERLAAAIRRDGFTDLLLLGGPGAGATAALFNEAFGPAPRGLALTALDCAAPAAVARTAAALPGERTLVLVISSSGAKTQVHDLVSYFQPWVERHLGPNWPAAFVAISEPDSPLAEQASRQGWRASLAKSPQLGRRFAALAPEGLLPLVLLGHDPRPLVDQAGQMWDELALGQDAGAAELAALLTAAARSGRNKVSLYADGAFRRWPAWLEIQIAAALGRQDQGLVPVAGEGIRQGYGPDRLFISFSRSELVPLGQLAEAGHPTARFQISEATELGREMVRFQVALAAVSALVEAPLIGEYAEGELEAETTRLLVGPEAAPTEAGRGGGGPEQAMREIEKMVHALGEGGHVRVSTYLDPESEAAVVEFCGWLGGLTMAPVTYGTGVCGVASEGQFHPPNWRSGVFVQLVDTSGQVPIPGRPYGFSELTRAQAAAERMALQRRGRPVVTVELNEATAASVRRLVELVPASRR